jgi:signal transduction histidine kinase
MAPLRFDVNQGQRSSPGSARQVDDDDTNRDSGLELVDRRLAAVLAIARDLSAAGDLADVVDHVQRRTMLALPCDRVVALVFDPESGMAHELGASRGGLQLSLPASVLEPLRAGSSVVLSDQDESNRQPGSVLGCFGAGALIAAPLLADENVHGALLALYDQAPATPGRETIEFLEGVARQLALAVKAGELHRLRDEEAEVAAALVHVAREVISFLDTPVLLERLCQLATDVLECDCSQTLLLDPETDLYRTISGYGYTEAEWAPLHDQRLPRPQIEKRLPPTPEGELVQAGGSGFGLASGRSLYVPLFRGPEVVGVLIAGLRDDARRFSRRQQRIATGLGRLASLALQNAHLLDELGRVSRLKSEFVATMSHELRTPLNAIIGYTDLLLDGTYGALTQEQQEKLGRVDNNAQALLQLINATLDVSRLETGRLPLELEDVSLEKLLAEVDSETREQRQSKPHVRFSWQIDTPLPQLHTDPVKVKVIVKNLVSNAVKFTDQGSITVRVAADENGVELAVTDTGPGIPPEAHGIIFEPFRQLDGSTTRRHGGVGLGLYIVRRLVDLLGGSFHVRSEIGRGSTFSVSLPTNPPPGA